MNAGEKVLKKIFGISNTNSDELKNDIIRRFKTLKMLDINFDSFKKIVKLLEEQKNNDKVNEYVNEIINQDESLGIKNLIDFHNDLIKNLEKSNQNMDKLKKLCPFASFLSECEENISNPESYLAGNLKKLIKQINNLQNDDTIVKDLIDIDSDSNYENIKNLFSINTAFTLPSNVFYRYTIKKQFENNNIRSLDDLFTKIQEIQNKEKEKTKINLKELKVHEFNDEIIIKTQNLMKEEKNIYTKNDIQICKLVYERIESNYKEFADLSEEDKKFLQTSIIKIMCFDDFEKLGSFFNNYFGAEKTDFNEVKVILSPLNRDDRSIVEFRKFSMFCKDNEKNDLFNKLLEEFVENERDWPHLDKIGIDIKNVSQFCIYWDSINQLITHFMNDTSNESVLLPTILQLLEDKNRYAEIQTKMQQAYIEPTLQSIYVIFKSVMKMLSASGISNKNLTFKDISNNAATFFVDYPPEFYKILTGMETLIINERKIMELLSIDKANAVIEEYDYVKKVVEGNYIWEVSFKNHVRLVCKNPTNEVVPDFAKLRLIAAKLNIVMIETENATNSIKMKNSKDFVAFFQTAESLYDRICILHGLNFDIGDKVFTYEALVTSKIEEIIEKLDKVIHIIDEKFSEVYKGQLCLLTKEQFFMLYKLINHYFKTKEKSKDLISIFEGTIISAHILKTKTPVDDYYKLIEGELEPFNLDDQINDEIIKKFKENLTNFSKILTNIISKLINEPKSIDDNIRQLDISGNVDEYLAGGTVRCINSNPIFNKDTKSIDVSSKYQLHSMILYLFKLYSHDPFPFPTQLLICTMSITQSQIDSFLQYFNSMTIEGEKRMFIVVSPTQLQPTLYNYLMSELKEINQTIISKSRIVILFENKDLDNNSPLNDVTRRINVDSFKSVGKTDLLSNLYKNKHIMAFKHIIFMRDFLEQEKRILFFITLVKITQIIFMHEFSSMNLRH